ncbi:MAG: ATP-binding protein [Methylophilaceae bacterium]|nr:ATP-binding protein [Methylophilaceae bacterium]
MRYVITIVAFIGIALLILLAKSLSNSELLSSDTFRLLLIFNIIFVCSLIVLITIQIARLLQNVKSEIVGSRLTMRLVLSFATVVIIPVTIVYLVSVSFLTKSIESWFNVQVESALQGGLSLGQKTLDILLKDIELKSKSLAYSISAADESSSSAILNDLREKFSIQEAVIFDVNSKILSVSGEYQTPLPVLPKQEDLMRASEGFFGKIEEIDGKIFMKAYVPIPSKELLQTDKIIQITQPIPESISDIALSVESVYEDYQTLAYSRSSLKIIYTMTLTLVLLLAILSAVAASFFLSRRISQPISLLADATRQIAKGKYDKTIPENSKDELGLLVKLFNSMTLKINDATNSSEKSRERLEIARAFLDTILTHLSSGVIVLDSDNIIKLHNITASKIIKFKKVNMTGVKFTNEISKNKIYQPIIKKLNTIIFKKPFLKEESFEFNTNNKDNEEIIRIQITPLKRQKNISYILVIDDITELTKGQRSQAWSEIARRLAHEIKNPLTPIQLSAERIEHKLKDKLSSEDLIMLKKSTLTIVNQVQALKTMVNEFSEYSRPTEKKIEAFNLVSLFENIIDLYQATGIKIKLSMSNKKILIKADENKIRQVIINLIENAKDGLAEEIKPEINIEIISENKSVTFLIEDNGMGISKELMGRIFEPYVTSKSTGTGLGLAIVNKIIEEHSGKIDIKRNKSKGISVSVRLPKQ